MPVVVLWDGFRVDLQEGRQHFGRVGTGERNPLVPVAVRGRGHGFDGTPQGTGKGDAMSADTDDAGWAHSDADIAEQAEMDACANAELDREMGLEDWTASGAAAEYFRSLTLDQGRLAGSRRDEHVSHT